jgi:hypothetical protein
MPPALSMSALFCPQFSDIPERVPTPLNTRKVRLFDLDAYDLCIVNLSSGKDSVTCALKLLDEGFPREKMRFWHQSVDGGPGSPLFMDWACTESYTKALGKALGVKTEFMWRQGGIKGELFRENRLTNPVQFIYQGEVITLLTTKGKLGTRRKWPAKSADLSRRYCSANAKIDVAARVISNHPEFQGSIDRPLKLLVISRERREESAARARYLEAEIHRCNTRSRIAHQYRPVIDYSEEEIWQAYERHKIMPHPAYILGFSRTSCLNCVFLTPDLWAMVRELFSERFAELVAVEKELNFTIDNKHTLTEMANMGSIKRIPRNILSSPYIQNALKGHISKEDIFIKGRWTLPAGAFQGNDGGSL